MPLASFLVSSSANITYNVFSTCHI